jgi:hypothetical protein
MRPALQCPVPRQKRVNVRDPVIRASTSANQACGSMSLSFAVIVSVAITAARSAPRSKPAKSHQGTLRRVVIGVRLQDASEAAQVSGRMLLLSVARGVIERCRRRPATKRPIVADMRLKFGNVGDLFWLGTGIPGLSS